MDLTELAWPAVTTGRWRATSRLSPWNTPIDLRLHRRLQANQTLLELVADHLVPVHEQAERFRDEVVLAGHDPGDFGLAALRLGGEQRVAHAGQRLEELQLEPNGFTSGMNLAGVVSLFQDKAIETPEMAVRCKVGKDALFRRD